mmetsp:Transcript_85496/g.228652  ORF Transcript_85496/g.228652 Transcript_85496/m.228652 type:complete len:261 (+) Transcript_85496:1830-2612(+)
MRRHRSWTWRTSAHRVTKRIALMRHPGSGSCRMPMRASSNHRPFVLASCLPARGTISRSTPSPAPASGRGPIRLSRWRPRRTFRIVRICHPSWTRRRFRSESSGDHLAPTEPRSGSSSYVMQPRERCWARPKGWRTSRSWRTCGCTPTRRRRSGAHTLLAAWSPGRSTASRSLLSTRWGKAHGARSPPCGEPKPQYHPTSSRRASPSAHPSSSPLSGTPPRTTGSPSPTTPSSGPSGPSSTRHLPPPSSALRASRTPWGS